ncbi:MAG: glycoside hydrolase family 127 protein [Verrucomicrobia bacterium]|nr:glycoside hydrolase family 127 protein [Verrucomicrobiota bacterium]
MHNYLPVLLVVAAQFQAAGVLAQEPRERVPGVWRSVPSAPGGGLFAERLELWRNGRLWHMLTAEDSYLLSGFESRPGRHPWQGEHVGKWLHAATLAYEQTQDAKLLKALQETVQRLLAAQDANGYLGTYGADYNIADDVAAPQKNGGTRKPAGGWDTWTLRYNIYGLLTYEKFHPDPRVVQACRKMADLLIEIYGEGKADITNYGTRQGISATTLLESIVMLYARTQEKKYLDFAGHIVALSENKPKLRLMGNMLEKGSVVDSGDGKAYQLMANLLGYLRLYESTGDERYLKTVQNAWDDIKAHHLDVTGGPWSIKTPYNGNGECFAHPQDYNPAAVLVETCSTTTWIQLNLHLLELTGQSRYAAEAERAVFNSLMMAQYGEGIDWCYYTRANQDHEPYESGIKCCSSSGPRALEMFSRYLIGEVDGAVAFTSRAPCIGVLAEKFGQAKIKGMGNYPISPKAEIRFAQTTGKEFAVEFKEPLGARLAAVRINGKEIESRKNERGFYMLESAWKSGDEVAIDFEYQLESHFALPKDGRKWVAFTYGPWALAQTTEKGAALAEPFNGKDIPSKAASEWLEPCPVKDGGLPEFRIKGSNIVLKPFFCSGSLKTGPRTYFKF